MMPASEVAGAGPPARPRVGLLMGLLAALSVAVVGGMLAGGEVG